MATKITIYNLTVDSMINYVRDATYGDDMKKYQEWVQENNISAVVGRNNIDFKIDEEALLFKLTFKV